MGSIWGGDFEIKNIQNKLIFFVLFHVEDIEDTVYMEYNTVKLYRMSKMSKIIKNTCIVSYLYKCRRC